VNPISNVRTAPIVPPVAPAVPSASGASAGSGATFGESLTQAVSAVNDLQLQARDAGTAIATGAPIDSARAFVTIEKANVSFQFAMQIRNKLLEAYQEVMRMAV
jgi:flagellar hook-basal body complex protein FliE